MVKKILKFSATWCAPCKAFEATLNKLKDTDDFKDIEIQSINIEGDNFSGTDEIKLETLSDVDGKVIKTQTAKYAIKGERISGQDVIIK